MFFVYAPFTIQMTITMLLLLLLLLIDKFGYSSHILAVASLFLFALENFGVNVHVKEKA